MTAPSAAPDPTAPALLLGRLTRVRAAMARHGLDALLTADPIDIVYATGLRNMTVYSMMGTFRFLLVIAEGPVIAWEFSGCEHLARGLPTVDEVRSAPGVTAVTAQNWEAAATTFGAEIAAACRDRVGPGPVVGVERVEFPLVDALRSNGVVVVAGTEAFMDARAVKLPDEIAIMRVAIDRVDAGVAALRQRLVPGVTEVEAWSELHRHLIATEGEYISTRLAQAGARTVPYFREASANVLADGDSFCLDTDALGYGGYGVDFSRTYLCGDRAPGGEQRSMHALALDQLRHNASLLAAGVSFEEFAHRAWTVPERFVPYGYYCLAHGLGLCGEPPYVARAVAGGTYPVTGTFEAGMVICVESYIGHPDAGSGVKLEDQYLVTDSGAERLTTAPFDPVLAGA